MLAVIRPEPRTIESERTGPERNANEIFDFWRGRTRIDASQPIIGRCLVIRGDKIEATVGENLSADLVRKRDRAFNLTGFSKGDQLFWIPLADVKPSTVVAELRTRIVRTRQRERRVESVIRNVAADDAIVFGRFATENT